MSKKLIFQSMGTILTVIKRYSKKQFLIQIVKVLPRG